MHALRTRLIRSTHSARSNFDYPAFQDLSDHLRKWTEFTASELSQVDSRLGKVKWRCVGMSKRFFQALRSLDAVVCVFPEEVTLHFERSHEIGGGLLPPLSGHSSLIVRLRGLPDGSKSISSFAFMRSGEVDTDDWKVASHPRMFVHHRDANLDGWWDSPMLWLGSKYEAGSAEIRSVSRKLLVKRLANAFGGAHLKKAAPTRELDELIDALRRHSILEVEVPYFLLLSVADQILAATRCLDS